MIAIAINAIIPGWRALISCHPVFKKTRPPVKNKITPKTAGMYSLPKNTGIG